MEVWSFERVTAGVEHVDTLKAHLDLMFKTDLMRYTSWYDRAPEQLEAAYERCLRRGDVLAIRVDDVNVGFVNAIGPEQPTGVNLPALYIGCVIDSQRLGVFKAMSVAYAGVAALCKVGSRWDKSRAFAMETSERNTASRRVMKQIWDDLWPGYECVCTGSGDPRSRKFLPLTMRFAPQKVKERLIRRAIERARGFDAALHDIV